MRRLWLALIPAALLASSAVAVPVAGTLEAQELLLRSRARSLSGDDRLALQLGAARAAYPGMIAGRRRDGEIYTAAVTGVTTALAAGNYADRTVNGANRSFHLRVLRTGAHRLDPSGAPSVLPAGPIRLQGLKRVAVEDGVGVPYVFCYPQGAAFLRGQPGVSRAGLSIPVTAFLQFDDNTATLSFFNRFEQDTVATASGPVHLAANFSAAIAEMLARTPNRPFDIPGLIFTRQHLPRAGLYQFQLYDRRRIPVVLVHGLFSRPEAWTQVLEGLLADSEIRKRYQFWFFLYPTGLPIWQSSMLLRADLDRFHRELERNERHPNLHRIVLVGHSMGGLISSLMVRDPGDSFWSALSDRSLDDLEVSPEARELVREMVRFKPRRDIQRVVYVTTPHRGSPIPHHPVIRQAIRVIQMPRPFDRRDRKVIVDAIREDLRGLFDLPANSIRFLKSGSPILEAVEALPLTEDIPYHSIIGDRGKGDTPDSTDGVVPYWSSHLKTAASEVIIPTDHSAPLYPETTREIRRILRAAAGLPEN